MKGDGNDVKAQANDRSRNRATKDDVPRSRATDARRAISMRCAGRWPTSSKRLSAEPWQRCTRPACKRARACRARRDCEGLLEQPRALTPERQEKDAGRSQARAAAPARRAQGRAMTSRQRCATPRTSCSERGSASPARRIALDRAARLAGFLRDLGVLLGDDGLGRLVAVEAAERGGRHAAVGALRAVLVLRRRTARIRRRSGCLVCEPCCCSL